ncbi:hypothetical protein [Actinopolymorpha alba]|uniref:hypothetical protein n=1 Tax=Actinopolymorpha alba TaxID=533267 RepID=UPI0003713C6F|nr:hypothetical protein [Actinopolymorpha alba]
MRRDRCGIRLLAGGHWGDVGPDERFARADDTCLEGDTIREPDPRNHYGYANDPTSRGDLAHRRRGGGW